MSDNFGKVEYPDTSEYPEMSDHDDHSEKSDIDSYGHSWYMPASHQATN